MKVGDLVKVKHIPGQTYDQTYVGVIVDIKEKKSLFSDKYSIVSYSTYLHIMCEDKIEIFDLDDCIIEVINESR
ncbi:MAG: hypothetical protein CBC29_06310 [Methylococcaceae bacterium TMED69]|nr:MAG: hypothetical protein CBC29_06310 [Methylococcaceae bacterium TMED69]